VKSETQISTEIADYLTKRGIFNLRLNAGRVKKGGSWIYLMPEGTPDRLCIVNKQAVFLEVKKPGEKATAKQLAMHDEIRSSGGIVAIVESVEDTAKVLRGL